MSKLMWSTSKQYGQAFYVRRLAEDVNDLEVHASDDIPLLITLSKLLNM